LDIGAPVYVSDTTPGWVCHRVQLEQRGETLRIGFSRPGSPHWCEVEVRRLRASDDGDHDYKYCQIDYHGNFGSDAVRVEEQVRTLVAAVGASIEARLAARPSSSFAEALGRTPGRRALPFNMEGVRELLSPLILEGAEACDGFRLTRIRTDNLRRAPSEAAAEVVLGFQRPGMQGHALFALALGSGDHQTFSRSTHLALRCLNEMPEADRLRAHLAYVLQLQDHEGVELTIPESVAEQAQAPVAMIQEAPAPQLHDTTSDRPVILSLSSPCHQACSFCSLRDTWQPEDGGATALSDVIEQLRSGRAQGADAYTLNGFDPLSFSRILDVLDAASELGYRHAEVFSPCTILADRAFCSAIAERLPASRRVHVPLYALNAEVHEAIVGRPGTFAPVMAALDLLIELVGPSSITITTVSTRANLHALPELFRFAIERGLDLFSTMPYPATNFATDRVVESSPRQTEVATVVLEALAATPQWVDRTTFGVAPCVIFPLARERGIPVQRWLSAPRRQPQLNGGPVPNKVACEHAASCVLAAACPAEHFERYVDRHGRSEFQPIALYDLLREAGAVERPSEGSARRESAATSSPR